MFFVEHSLCNETLSPTSEPTPATYSYQVETLAPTREPTAAAYSYQVETMAPTREPTTTSTQECDLIASRSNTRTDLPKGHHSAPANERPWCYNLNVNKLADEDLGCDDYYSMGGSGKVRLCVPDGTGDPASSDGKCDSTAFFYCP